MLRVKDIIYEDFVNYKKPSMFIITPYCNFKCNKEYGNNICQNLEIIKKETISLSTEEIVNAYIKNPITSAVVFGGLEPLDHFSDVIEFINVLREEYNNNDDVVIYTGYNKDEINNQIDLLKKYNNIIIKYGRYVPNQTKHYDKILGVFLVSDNQYAEKIS